MAQTSVRAGQPAEQDEATDATELMAVEGYPDEQLHLVKTGNQQAGLIRFRAGGHAIPLATATFGEAGTAVDIRWTPRGKEVSQHLRNVWETWVQTAVSRWHRGGGANVLGCFDAAGVQVKVSRYTNTRIDEEGIHLADAGQIGVTVGVRERERLVLVGHRYTKQQQDQLAVALAQFMAAREKSTS